MSEFSLIEMNRLLMPWQNPKEWRTYLEFIEGYFRCRKIKNPFVVELGVLDNNQKKFYEELLGYTHIGIDIDPEKKPDIVGDSKDFTTVNKLEKKLGGREISLLFIDADHKYESVKKDYELFSPFVKNLIVLHDVVLLDYKNTVGRFWNELQQKNRKIQDRTFITIASWLRGKFGHGIGIIKLDDKK